ncbi:myb-like protein AA [Anoplophora glabripennis]|uniref:myb-like protein AA n=1 Tax=Anoplophora glabripennis TaxID=217634 RepID=UPI00087436C3|nr:myb-like protein AA [Anoplophora glabripennis]
MNLKSILCVSLAAVTLTLGNNSQDGVQQNGDASYEFGYDIHNPLSNDIKSHHEVRDGKNVLGFYTFREADGSIRVVKYKVTPETGFEAVVEKLPDPLSGNAIDGQEAAPSPNGAAQTINEQNGGANSQYVAGTGGINNNRNPRGNVPAPPAQNYNGNPPVQGQAQEPQQHHHPGVIRNNQRGAVQDQNQGVQAQGSSYLDIPRARQKNPYIAHQRLLLEGVQQQRQRNQIVAPQPQTQQYADNPAQPNSYGSGKIIYINGVAYIDDIGLYSNSQDQNGNTGQLVQNPQYELIQNPDSEANDEAATNAQNNEEVEEDDFEEDDDEEDEDLANFEEEDEEEDEDTDASDLYEQNEQFITDQKEAYARLKQAYEEEEDGQKPKEEGVQEQQAQPVQAAQ